MPSPYHIALLLIRLFGTIHLVGGAGCLLFSVITALGPLGDGGVPSGLLVYAITYLAGGAGMIVFCKPLAGFVAKQ